MTNRIPRTVAPSRSKPDTGNRDTRAAGAAAIPNPRARAAVEHLADDPAARARLPEVAASHGVSLSTLYRALRAAGIPRGKQGRKRAPDSPMARALESLRADPALTIRAAAEARNLPPQPLYRAARRCSPPLPNPYGTGPKGRKPGSHSEPAMGSAGAAAYQLRLPEPARAVARHLGAARVRHLLLTVGAALEARAAEAARVAEATRAAGGRLGLVAPAVAAVHARPLVITLPPVHRPARRQEHARTLAQPPHVLALPDPDHPTAPPQTLPARQLRAATRAAALAPVDAMATAQGLPALTTTLATLGRVVAACRRLAADGRMPANVGALRDACQLLGVPHLTPPASPTPREPKAPAHR